jgi:hypothetical protein
MPNEHLFIPDVQAKPGLDYEHLEALANYIIDKKPNVIIHAGDHWDMRSLSLYDKGTIRSEGTRYQDDIDAGIEAMEALLKPLKTYNRFLRKKYRPRMVFLLGNHEERIMRHVAANPSLQGKLSYQDLKLEKMGWEVHDFLDPVTIDGIAYAHYFYNPMSGKPWGGKAPTMLNNVGFSFTMGHRQGLDLARKHLANGRTIRGLVAGSFYQHDEEYKGPQGNHHWRGVIYKHDVHDGNYDLMEVSMKYLLSEWT